MIMKINIIIRDWEIIIIMDIDGRVVFCIKITDVSRDIIMMLRYSDIKIRAKGVPAYSVLNPDTSSLSPSAKSNGVRFVSANRQIIQIYNITGASRNKVKVELFIIHWRLNLIKNRRAEINHRAIVTSYEIVWAILRRAPNRAYFELDDHPLPIVV
ncbi:MAG: hypothetical protein MPJ22_00160 [Pirellulales bacterium]|nr:hypothetical protein [Pirellulales bacterium]